MSKTFVVFIAVLIAVLAMLFYPTLHTMISDVDKTGWLPLTAAAVVALPFVFLGYAVYLIKNRH